MTLPTQYDCKWVITYLTHSKHAIKKSKQYFSVYATSIEALSPSLLSVNDGQAMIQLGSPDVEILKIKRKDKK